MDALTIRRYKGLSTPQYQAATRTEKSAAAVEGQKVNRSTGLAVSETLRQLMSKVSQVERHIRESHRTLQTGETVLDEVRSSLDRIGQLAEEAAGGGVRSAECSAAPSLGTPAYFWMRRPALRTIWRRCYRPLQTAAKARRRYSRSPTGW